MKEKDKPVTIEHHNADAVRVSAAVPAQDVKIEPGSRQDQRLTIINEGHNDIALNEASAVRDGKPCSIEKMSAKMFWWNIDDKRWHEQL